MPIDTEGNNVWCPSYAEVFDWFMSRGICICMTCTRRAFRMPLGYGYVVQKLGHGYVVQNIDKFYVSECYSHSFAHAAIRAIDKAITMI